MAGSKSGRMIRNAMMMMAGTFSSRILGLLREVITAAYFGAGRSLDAFFVAFTVANLGRQLLAEGALSAAFVPVFSQVLEADGKKRAAQLARRTLTILLVCSTLLTAVGIFFSPALIHMIAPGFPPEKSVLAVKLARRMFPFLILISGAALAMGTLNTMGSFFIPAVSPALSNLIYIVIVIALTESWGIESLVVAVLAGGAAQMLLQWFWAARKKGILLIPGRPDFEDRDLRRCMKLFIPYAAGLSLNQLNPVLGRLFGSFLADGAISMLNYSNRVIQLPLGLVVIAISQAVLPELSRNVTRGDDVFAGTLRDAVRFAAFCIMPVMLGTLLVSSEAVHFIFYRGAFDAAAWHGTASTLFWSAWGLPGMALSTVVMRALFARSLPRDAMLMTASSVCGTLFFSVLLLRPMGMNGIALAGSSAFALSSAVGVYFLHKDMKHPMHLFSLSDQWPMLAASVAMLLCGVLWKTFIPYPVRSGIMLRGTWLVSIAFMCAAVYGGIGYYLKCDEWKMIMQAVRPEKTE